MNTEPEDLMSSRLSKALFGVQRLSDEGLFTSRVMREIRELRPVSWEPAWPNFLRWAVPLIGVGVASLFLATRTPVFSLDDNPNINVSADYP